MFLRGRGFVDTGEAQLSSTSQTRHWNHFYTAKVLKALKLSRYILKSFWRIVGVRGLPRLAQQIHYFALQCEIAQDLYLAPVPMYVS